MEGAGLLGMGGWGQSTRASGGIDRPAAALANQVSLKGCSDAGEPKAMFLMAFTPWGKFLPNLAHTPSLCS